MKYFSRYRVSRSILIGLLTILGSAPSAWAQTVSGPTIARAIDQGISLPSNVEAALSYPNSSQRFFEVGNLQLEQEIRRLLDEEEPAQPLLTVRPEVLEQFED